MVFQVALRGLFVGDIGTLSFSKKLSSDAERIFPEPPQPNLRF
jgi:hypothetical protein